MLHAAYSLPFEDMMIVRYQLSLLSGKCREELNKDTKSELRKISNWCGGEH